MLGKHLSLAGLVAAATFLTPAESFADPFQPPIRPGPSVRAVMCIQQILAYCMSYPVPTDGVFGPETRRGLLDLQRFFSLQADGILGPQVGDVLKLVGTSCNIRGVGTVNLWDYLGCQQEIPTTR